VSRYDVDQDGTISLDEFCHFILSRNSNNPSDWLTVDHLTTPTTNDRTSQTFITTSTAAAAAATAIASSSSSYSTQRHSKKSDPLMAHDQTIEHQTKLFLQGMKSVLMKSIFEDREAGRISKSDRLNQKTSQLILTQSKSILQQLFAPYVTASANSHGGGIPFHGFKRFLLISLSSLKLNRILSKFIPAGSSAYGDEVFEYLFQACCSSPEEGARADTLYSLIFDTGTLVENKFGFVKDIPPVTETGRSFLSPSLPSLPPPFLSLWPLTLTDQMWEKVPLRLLVLMRSSERRVPHRNLLLSSPHRSLMSLFAS
jgi:hypothetical protein